MSNKIKETMEYWKHSTMLFEDEPMQVLIAKEGIIGYTIYCYFMEKINRVINSNYMLTDDLKWLAINRLQITENKFNQVLNTMIDLGMFDKKKYETNKVLTNVLSENNKDIVKNYRNYIKEKVKEHRSKKNCKHLQSDCNYINNNDNVIYNISKYKLSKDNISKDNISKDVFIGDKKITTKQEIYTITQNLFKTKALNETQIKRINSLIDNDVEILAKAIEKCQISANEKINMNYLSKVFQETKSLNLANFGANKDILENKDTIQADYNISPEDEKEEFERLKAEAIERRKNNQVKDPETNLSEAEMLEQLKVERKMKKNAKEGDVYNGKN